MPMSTVEHSRKYINNYKRKKNARYHFCIFSLPIEQDPSTYWSFTSYMQGSLRDTGMNNYLNYNIFSYCILAGLVMGDTYITIWIWRYNAFCRIEQVAIQSHIQTWNMNKAFITNFPKKQEILAEKLAINRIGQLEYRSKSYIPFSASKTSSNSEVKKTASKCSIFSAFRRFAG